MRSELSSKPPTKPDAERASLLAELEALGDVATAKLAVGESLEALRWDVAERKRAAAAVREHGHIGATWMDDCGIVVA